MAILPMTIKHLEDSEGLTCIENQLIGVLRYLGLPYQAILLKSYIGISDTIREFHESNIDFSHYNRIERLQFTAQSLGIAYLTYYNPVSYETMLHLLENELEKGLPIMVRVDPIKLPRTNDILPWRDEHFISLFGIVNDEVLVLDDVPLRSISISFKTLCECFQDEVLVINVLEGIKREDYICRAQNQINLITNNTPVEIEYPFIKDVCFKIDNLITFRDAIGILRTSRRRINVWLKWMEDYIDPNSFKQVTLKLEQQINTLNRLYSAIEFCRLRRRINDELLLNLFRETYEIEKAWLDALKMIS